MSFDDWMLALHVLTARSRTSRESSSSGVLIVAVRKTDTAAGTMWMEPIVKVGNAAVGIGAAGTIMIGIWLAFRSAGYAIWDGWIIAAFVLWAIAAVSGSAPASSTPGA